MIVEICRGLARFGPKRFYVLNTGVSTNRALAPAAEILAADGILMRYTDLLKILEPVEKQVARQEGGTHADEIETSMILYMSPADADMSKAVKDYHPGQGGLTRDPRAEGKVYSPSGRLRRRHARDEGEGEDRDGGARRGDPQGDRGAAGGAAAGPALRQRRIPFRAPRGPMRSALAIRVPRVYDKHRIQGVSLCRSGGRRRVVFPSVPSLRLLWQAPSRSCFCSVPGRRSGRPSASSTNSPAAAAIRRAA